MSAETFEITKERKIAVTLAYVAYAGETLTQPLSGDKSVTHSILHIIEHTLPELQALQKDGVLDWRIVWGPAIYTLDLAVYQDNMMYVAQSISDPSQYFIVIRGTNGVSILDWAEEDFAILRKVGWVIPEGQTADGKPEISEATHTGLQALLSEMVPDDGLPGAGRDISSFLRSITQTKPASITFTGHSLAGALCEALGLWFKQFQGVENDWNPQQNAAIKIISFAGATPGNTAFANYFNAVINGQCQRIHNTNDMVPHAWEQASMEQAPDLYASIGIKFNPVLKTLVDLASKKIDNYKQVNTSVPFTWPLQPEQDTYAKQALYQHVDSYIGVLEVENPRPLLDDYQQTLETEAAQHENDPNKVATEDAQNTGFFGRVAQAIKRFLGNPE
ncbi:MAG: hypothetical protein AAF512_05615 [Pseudomonadota bacterium]